MRFILALVMCLCLYFSAYAQDIVKVKDKQIYKTTLGENSDEIIIGDEKFVDFKPQITFTKWNKENSLTIKAVGLVNSQTPILTAGKLEVKNSKTGFYFTPDGTENFKFGLILYEKPLVNSWSFQLEGWEEFSFNYQDTLENDYKNGLDVLPGQTLQEYLTDRQRPDDVVGSYAVYHKTKRNHEIGKTNYMAGKAFHIYRPRFIDADGKLVWAELNIKDGVYTVTVPQDFLDSAKYPVKANDTIGYTTLGASSSSGSQSNQIQGVLSPGGALAADGTLTKAYWGGTSDNVVRQYEVAVYTDNAGEPNAYVADTGTLPGLASGGKQWHPADSPNGAAISGNLVQGTTYWVCFVLLSANSTFAYDSASGQGFYGVTLTFGNDWPATIGSHTNSTSARSIYCEYTTGGAQGIKKGLVMRIM